MDKKLVIVRGGGDLATGVVQALVESGFRVLVLEIEHPAAIRRQVALCEAVYQKVYTVENMTCRRCENIEELDQVWQAGEIPLLLDPTASCIIKLQPWAVVDAILAKKNLGTKRQMAPHTLALGPGFTAGKDVEAVIETKRGHQLGRIIWQGEAIANTGIPGLIAGFGRERVIHSACPGYVYGLVDIGDKVVQGQCLAVITPKPLAPNDTPTVDAGTPVLASLTGFVRGLIRPGYLVPQGFKIADIDPRPGERENCFTISDKARSLGGAVVVALAWLQQKEGNHD